jgi:hypothetical protein
MACLTPPFKLAILPQTVTYVLNLCCDLCLEPIPVGVGVGIGIENMMSLPLIFGSQAACRKIDPDSDTDPDAGKE